MLRHRLEALRAVARVGRARLAEGLMTARRLLNLYPRAWRARYGDEFLETVANGDLRLQQIVDIISSAVDAWLSADVRHATRPASAVAAGGNTMTVRAMICRTNNARYTTRDSLIGAAIMIILTVIFALAFLIVIGYVAAVT